MSSEKEKTTRAVAYLLYVRIVWFGLDDVIRKTVQLPKLEYLDEEQGKKNPTDRSVLCVRENRVVRT